MYESSSVYSAQTDSPLGRIVLLARGSALCGLYFMGQADCPSIMPADQVCAYESGQQALFPASTKQVFDQARHQLDAWFAGRSRHFDLPLHLQGTAFQQKVWQVLQTIPFGQCLTYGQVAERVAGSVNSSRAVGAAIGKNPVSIIVPCHRVVGQNGRLTGFSGGLHRKSALLAHEGWLLV